MYKFKIIVDPTMSISSHANVKTALSVFPNPVVNEVKVSFNTDKQYEPVNVFDMEGRLVYLDNEIRDNGRNTVKVEMGTYADGVYFVQVGSDTFKVMHVTPGN